MTATPRIYGEVAKAKAEKESVALCSMNDSVLQRADAFWQLIEAEKASRIHKVSSRHIAGMLQNMVGVYHANEPSKAAVKTVLTTQKACYGSIIG